jgi:hypothetical protein
MKTILDISHHQKGLKLNSLTGVDGYIYRACVGTAYVDKSLDEFIGQNNTPKGLYVASYAKNAAEAAAEAEYIIKIAGKCKNKPVLFFDWEYFSAKYIKEQFNIDATPKLIKDMTKAFCDKCMEKGFKTGVYFNKDFLDRFYGRDFFEQNPKYCKWYSRPGLATPDFGCDIWQYAGQEGTEFGTSMIVDKNIQYTELDGTVFTEQMQPISDSPVRMVIGYASGGDIKKLETQITGLGIECEINDGFIYTGEVSRGDQCSIMLTAGNLGIPVKEYVEITCPNNIEKPQKVSFIIWLLELILKILRGENGN